MLQTLSARLPIIDSHHRGNRFFTQYSVEIISKIKELNDKEFECHITQVLIPPHR